MSQRENLQKTGRALHVDPDVILKGYEFAQIEACMRSWSDEETAQHIRKRLQSLVELGGQADWVMSGDDLILRGDDEIWIAKVYSFIPKDCLDKDLQKKLFPEPKEKKKED